MTLRQIGLGVWQAARYVLLASLAVILGALSFYGWIHSDGNQYTVVPGVLYRSAQPSAETLPGLQRKFGFRTILNLRGEHPGAAWYDAEQAFAVQNGIALVSVSLSAGRVLTGGEIQRLEEVLASAPRPILVHCKSGSDRTGIVCAIYRLWQGDTLGVAAAELSLRYGHFPYLWSESQAMDDSLALYHHGRKQPATLVTRSLQP